MVRHFKARVSTLASHEKLKNRQCGGKLDAGFVKPKGVDAYFKSQTWATETERSQAQPSL